MTLQVSGAEFVTSFNRLQFVAERVSSYRLAHNPPVAVTPEQAAEYVVMYMRQCQRRGWNLGQKVLDILKSDCRM